jgi:hypothetical protein
MIKKVQKMKKMKMLKNHSETCFQHFLSVFGKNNFFDPRYLLERSDIKN